MLEKTQNTAKAVAPVVGFILILAILFLAAGQYQANVVPVEERSAEIDHFSGVSEDISGLRSSIIQSSTSGEIQTQEIDLGVTYGVLGLSQPPRSGSLTYINRSEEIEIRNAQNNREASNFWRGDVNRSYETGFLQYEISYNRVNDHADIYLEHGLMYRDTARGTDEVVNFLAESDQQIINGRSITLYTLQSDMGTVSRVGTSTVETNPTSAPMNSISLTNVEDDSPIEIQLPTRLSVEDWEDILENEKRENNDDGYINNIRAGEESETIVLELEEDETYNLQMSRIDLSTQGQSTVTPFTEEQYIAVDRETANVREDSNIQLDAEVRDKYNNGVIGVEVEVEAQDANQQCIGDFTGTTTTSENTNCNNDGDYRQPGIDISSSDGSVTYEYNAPEIETDRDVTFIYRMDSE